MTPAAQQLRAARRTASYQTLENKFALYWQGAGGGLLVREYRFHPVKKWRFDFALPAKLIAIEVHGGTWRKEGGAHQGSGFVRDCEKLNEAQMLGWRVLQFTDRHIRVKFLEPVVKWAQGEPEV